VSDRFEIVDTPLPQLMLVRRKPIGDSRGYLERLFCADELKAVMGDKGIKQVNRTLTVKRGTVRGMHFQYPPHSELKLVSCLRGEVFDVAVDVREGSATFLHWHGETLSGAGHFPRLPDVGELKSQLVASHSFSMAPIPLAQATAFAAAEKRIWITNPYCTPTDDQVDLLTKAVQRGVDVRLLLPGENNDQPMTKSAGRSAYGRMLEGGVKIFEYQPTMIHTKSMVVDSLFSMRVACMA